MAETVDIDFAWLLDIDAQPHPSGAPADVPADVAGRLTERGLIAAAVFDVAEQGQEAIPGATVPVPGYTLTEAGHRRVLKALSL